MADGVSLKKSEVYSTVDQRLQGSEEFVEQVLEQHDEGAQQWKRRKEHSLDHIARTIAVLHGLNKNELSAATRARPVTYGRRLFSFTAKEYGYTGKEIADYLRVEPAAVTGYEKRRGDMESALKAVIRYLESGKT